MVWPKPPAVKTDLMTNCQISPALVDALAEAHHRYAQKRPQSQKLYLAAQEVMPGGNTRSNLAYAPFPTAMARGQDCRLWDVDGHEYLDLCGEYTAGLFGHSEARIHEGLIAAMRNGLSLAAVGAAEGRFARLMCERFASVERIRFTNSGTEANLIALSAARIFTGRKQIIAFRGGYHGSVLYFPVEGESPIAAPFPVTLCDYNDIPGTLAKIAALGAELAAVIVEPMMGSGGSIPAEPDFLVALQRACQANGSLFILDEVMTSRMAAGGMQALYDVQPDLTTFGKYMGGGMSFGAFGGRKDVMEIFAAKVTHAGTFNNNVMTMAAGSIAMGEIFTAKAAEDLYELGEDLLRGLNRLICSANAPMRFAGRGSLATPHFRRGEITRPYQPSAKEEALKELFFFDMLEEGIYLARRGMHALSLPVTAQQLDRYSAAVARFLVDRAELLAS